MKGDYIELKLNRRNIDDLETYFLNAYPIVVKDDMSIWIHVTIANRKFLKSPHFKVFNHGDILQATKVAFLGIKDNKFIRYHDPIVSEIWNMSKFEIERVYELLSQQTEMPGDFTNWNTNWNWVCYQWNCETNMIPYHCGIQNYLTGKYNLKNMNPKAGRKLFVPSTQPMPKTWRI